jgi:hypothetical protein
MVRWTVEAESKQKGNRQMTDTALEPRQDIAPVNLGHAFDLMLPLADRTDGMLDILELAAELTVRRDEQDNPDAYADEDFRRQEVKRRTLKGVEDLRQIANVLELRVVMETGGETWIDADGAEVSLLEVIESQMPDEERRNSSGRARQIWSFLDTAQAFREQGIPDREIAECARSGMSSVFGIVARAQRRLEEVAPPDELSEKYEQLIQLASETTKLGTLEQQIDLLVDPTDVPPPPILYSIENDGISDGTWYFVAKLTHEQFTDVILRRLGDMLEVDKLLPAAFVQYWRSFAVVAPER